MQTEGQIPIKEQSSNSLDQGELEEPPRTIPQILKTWSYFMWVMQFALNSAATSFTLPGKRCKPFAEDTFKSEGAGFYIVWCSPKHCQIMLCFFPRYFEGAVHPQMATTSIYMGWPAESGSPLFHTTFVTNCREGQVRQLPLGLWCIWKINFKKHCCNIMYKFLWFQILRCL